MLRVFLVLAAVLAAVLAFVFDRLWLYAAAAVPLLGALALFGWSAWTASRESADSETPSAPPDDSLEDLGIMDVRPQEQESSANGTSEPAPTPVEDQTPTSEETGAASKAHEERLDEHRDERRTSPTEASSSPDAPVDSPPAQSTDRPVLGPLLESLRAALGAQTVCLLVQENVALDYEIAALASVQPEVQRDGHFETQSPLLTATMSRQPVTVRSLDESDRTDLAYYDTVPVIAQVAVAPLSRPDTSASVFLLADATAEIDLGTSHARSLLKRFAETVGEVLDVKEVEQEQAGRSAEARRSAQAASDGTRPEPPAAAGDGAGDSVEGEEQAPRPRRDIIAEEMQAADAADEPLALVLVHLNRAESIARRGAEAVERAERHMQARLSDLVPGQRVERFGELTYGLFLRRPVEAVETQAMDLQDALAQEAGELDGGVSVGVAMRNDRHSPEGLREDATEALLDAYETGACTIIE